MEAEDFDAVLLPGGVINADNLRMDEDARRIANSGLVKGRQLTSYFTLQDDIRNAGGKWQDKETLSMALGLQQKTGRHPGI